MSSRFPPSNNGDSRLRDRSPSGPLDARRSSVQYNDGSLAPRHEGSYRGNDSYGYTARGREPIREPPRGPRAQEAPRGGSYLSRGRGGFLGRGDARERDFRDTRDEPFGRGARGRGQDWGPRDRFDIRDRRTSPTGRDRSRSPMSRDFPRDNQNFAPRGEPREPRRDLRDASFSGASDVLPFRGRGGFRGTRGRGDSRGGDDRRGAPSHLNERDSFGPRSRSRDREWDEPMRDDRDRERDFELGRRDDDFRKERDDRDDRFRREPFYRPDSRNSTGGALTPITSRSTSTASIRQSNMERYNQNTRDNRDSLSDHRPRAQGSNADLRMAIIDRDSERGDTRPRSAGNDRYEHRTDSPPPQAPPVPAFGSIPQRAAIISQASPAKPEPPRDQSSPPIHPSRLSLLDPSIHVPSAPKAQTFNAPTAPKAQQVSERWQSRDTSERPKSLDRDASRFVSQRQSLPAPPEPIRNISRRFSQSRNDYDISPIKPTSTSATGAPDSPQPSVRKAVEEQGRNGNAPSTTGGSSSMLRPPSSDRSSQKTPVKIPTGPRAERAAPAIRQPAPSMRGGAIRGPSMMQRPGRGSATWNWVNPALPKHVPRGPSIMNTVPTKRDSIGDDKFRAGPPTAESTEDALAKWKRDHAPASITTARIRGDDHPLGSPRSASILHNRDKGNGEDGMKTETSNNEQSRPGDGAVEDDQIDWGEEDYAKDEQRYEIEMRALEARRPLTPRSNPSLLDLLEEIDALASAIEEKARISGQDTETLAQSRLSGLPSPRADEEDKMEIKQELASPPPANVRPGTPLLESLPFLVSGIPTPFSEIEDLEESTVQQNAIQDAIRHQLEEQARTFEAQIDDARHYFVEGFREWKKEVEEFEEAKRRKEIEAIKRTKLNDDEMDVSPVLDELPCFTLPAPAVGRRLKNTSELDMQEILRVSQETAAKEELARREKDPIYVPPNTFSVEREANVPAMLSEEQREISTFVDTNGLVDPNFVLEALEFTPKKDDFTSAEQELFLYNYVHYPKRFGILADMLEGRDFRDCVHHYYVTKRFVKYKDQENAFLKTTKGKRLAKSAQNNPGRPKTGLLPSSSSLDGQLDPNPQMTALTEKGRPRRAAAPIFGDFGEAESTAVPALTPARRGAPGKESGVQSAEKQNIKRTRTKEKGARKAKAQLLAAAPGPSPQKSVPAVSQILSSEPVLDSEPRPSDMETAEALAGLGSSALNSQPQAAHMYLQGPSLGWSNEHQVPSTAESLQQPSQQYNQDPPHTLQPKSSTQSTTSSYWSVPEVQDFQNYVRHFGTNWHEIAATMKTKTPTMIRNYYNRRIGEGEAGIQLEKDVKGADEMITNGQDMGPLPAQTPTGEKRRSQYNQSREVQRPLAPSVDSAEIDDSPKVQPTRVPASARFKQEQARFSTQPTSDQGLEQVSLQLQSQGMKSIENRPVIMPSSKPVQQQQQILGKHLGTFIPEERNRAYYSARDTVAEREPKETQNRPQTHQAQLQAQLPQQPQQEREPIQRQQVLEGQAIHRNRLSQHQNEQAIQSFQQHTPHLISDPLNPMLVGQKANTNVQAGGVPPPGIELTMDGKTRDWVESRVQQQQHQQAVEHQQQQQQQQQTAQQPYVQRQSQQRQPRIDTSSSSSMRRFGPYGNTASQTHSPASASLAPMSPPVEPLRPSSVPVNTSAQAPPPGPPKKSNILDLLNNDAPEPSLRKRLSDQQRPAVPTPPPQQPAYQLVPQQMQPQIQRRETPTDAMMHMHLQQRPPAFGQPTQHQQQIPPPPPPIRERNPNWAITAQQLQQRSGHVDERSVQAQVISPQSQSSFQPARNSIQALQHARSHVPSPPPQLTHHSRNPSFVSAQQMQQQQQQQQQHHQHQQHQQHHQQQYQQHIQQQRLEQQQQSLPSTPAEPNIRPSPYASLNPSHPPPQPQQPQISLQQRLEIQQREAQLMEQQQQAQRQAQQQAQHQNPHYHIPHQQDNEISRRQPHMGFGPDFLQRRDPHSQQLERVQLQREVERREREERDRFPATFYPGNGQGR